MVSRHNDTSGVQCEDCGWEGQVCGCRHGYISVRTEIFGADVEPMDFCPVCGSDQLMPIEEELVPA